MELYGMIPLRYFSVTNDFIDFVVFVPGLDADAATKFIRSAMSEFWEQDNEPYGDILYRHMATGGFPHMIVHQPWDDENDEPDTSVFDYQKWLEKLRSDYSVLTVLD